MNPHNDKNAKREEKKDDFKSQTFSGSSSRSSSDDLLDPSNILSPLNPASPLSPLNPAGPLSIFNW